MKIKPEEMKNNILDFLPDINKNSYKASLFISEEYYHDLLYYREVCESVSQTEKLLYLNGFKIYIDPELKGTEFKICDSLNFKE